MPQFVRLTADFDFFGSSAPKQIGSCAYRSTNMDQKLKEAIYGLRLCLPVDCQSMPSGFSFRKWADVKRGQTLYRQFYQTLHQELRSKNFHIFPSMFFDIPGMASYKLGLAESSPELLEDCSHVAKELDALGCLWRRFCGAWLVTGSWPEVQCSFFGN